jgi:hypothetical protein
MRPSITPSQPPAAPQATSTAFQTSPSFEPRMAWTISIAPEYAATSSAARSGPRVLEPSALSAVNPTSAKAAILYDFRKSTWNENASGEVISYNSLLVAAQNITAATSDAATIQTLLALPDPGESS